MDTRTGERVAIKAMCRREIDDNPRLVTLLEREINISLKLDHPGIIQLLDVRAPPLCFSASVEDYWGSIELAH